MSKTRIIQFTPSISHGDAVSNDIFAMASELTRHGYENKIVAINITESVKGRVVNFSSFVAQPDDIFIYHMSIGSDLTEYIINAKVKCRIMVYHNITPAHFFKGIPNAQIGCINGRAELIELVDHIDFAICDSDYNKEELDTLGYKNTVTLPIIFDDSDYKNTIPSEKLLKKHKDDGYTNIIFVGRIAPNKKQEDIIASFHVYNKYINPKSRLILVGSATSMENYYESLEDYIAEHNIKNVIFPGHISFADILAYYKLADVFLCQSEHEGFCVPLLEAMVFDVPIIAYASSAIPYTLGDSGIMFTQKDHRIVAELINLVVTNEEFRKKIIAGQRKRLADFDANKVKSEFMELINPYIN